MTDPIHATDEDPAPLRLVLDEGERLELQPADRGTGGQAEVVLRMPAWRAADLARVLSAYSRMSAIFMETSQVSTIEASLARALKDAAAAARADGGPPVKPSKIRDEDRLKAMSVLQAARPELGHSQLVAIVDAAAWWLDNDMDHLASELLGVVEDDLAMELYFTLLGRPTGMRRQAASAG